MNKPIQEEQLTTIPLLPLRDVVVYPHMVIPLFVGRESSINALEAAMSEDKEVLLVAQKNAEDDAPAIDDLYQVGTVATILQLLKLPDGTVKVLVEGTERAKLVTCNDEAGFFTANASYLIEDELEKSAYEILVKTTLSQFEKYVNLGKKVPSDVLSSVNGIEEPGRLADTIASHMSLSLDKKQEILELYNIAQRLEHIVGILDGELDLFQVEKRIRGRV